MISKRKLFRELARLKKQTRGLHWRVLGSLQRTVYDLRRHRLITVTDGEQPVRPEMAVLLIYQPTGVLASTLLTLSWLNRFGVSPVVVSNLPLSETDLSKLKPLCHLILQRPNVGYDFGGYRDGILTLLDRGYDMQALYVLNDSIWLPLREDCDVIERSRAATADLFGLHMSRFSRREAKEHLQSYFFRFSSEMIKSPDFSRYWRALQLINDKYIVIRMHERNLTRYFTKRGWKADSVVPWEALITQLLAMPNDDLREVVEFQCRCTPTDGERLRPLLDDARGMAAVRPEIDALISERRVFATLVTVHPALLRDLGLPFLKKARIEPLAEQRRLIAVLGIDQDYAPCVRDEISHWDSV